MKLCRNPGSMFSQTIVTYRSRSARRLFVPKSDGMTERMDDVPQVGTADRQPLRSAPHANG